MTTYGARSGTLTPNTAVPVDIRVSTDGFTVVNRSQTGQIWVRRDGNAATVAGDECRVVLGARWFPYRNTQETVSLISDAALDYTIEGAE